ncbi:MAG: DUF4214 domain-containing protein, partial [Methylococcales bacterium]|nr:DUF4214 domain-containing protein [Methylococcales bacterium]
MSISVEQKKTIIELYSAYFNRAPDSDGVKFWSNSFEVYFKDLPETFSEVNKEQFSLLKVSQDISTAKEYTDLYPSSLNHTDFITNIYANLLGRAPDIDGRDFWVKHLDQGTMTSGEAIMRLIEGAQLNTSTQGLLDAQLIANKTAVSIYFVDQLQSNDLELAKTILSNITSDLTTVDDAKVLLDSELGITPAPTPAPTPEPTPTDTTAPTVSISSNVNTLKTGEMALISFTFSEKPVDFTLADVSVTEGSLSNLIQNSNNDQFYTATLTPTASSSAVSMDITVGTGYQDAAGNTGVGSTMSPSLTMDMVAPFVIISSDKAVLKTGETSLITIQFSETPTGFTNADINLVGGSLSPIKVNAGDRTIYTATFTPDTLSANGSITVGTDYFDAAGNAGTAGVSPTLTIDTIVPTVAISSN